MTDCTTANPEVVDLFRQAQTGDRMSLAELMRQHDGLVHHIVRQQWHGASSYTDVLQEGRIGLWQAILGFDPQRGFAFSTYASVAIARRVWRGVAQAEKEEEALALLPRFATEPDPLTWLLRWEVHAALHALVEKLPDRQRWILRAYYGLDGQGGHTLAQLAHQLGCTRQAVHYHLRRAILRLCHPAFSAILRALLERNRRQDYLQALRPARRQS